MEDEFTQKKSQIMASTKDHNLDVVNSAVKRLRPKKSEKEKNKPDNRNWTKRELSWPDCTRGESNELM